MESKELIGAIEAQLDQVEAQGAQQVQVSALRAYLSALQKNVGTSQQYQDRAHAGMLAHYSAKNEHSIEMLKAVLEAGKSALHALLIIHSGAAIALLGVMSNLAGKDGGQQLARYLALPLLQFGIGVLVGAAGFALRYFSQACLTESLQPKDKFHVWGGWFRVGAITSAFIGYALFGLAVVNAYQAVIWSFPR
jgi:hypothetical protein